MLEVDEKVKKYKVGHKGFRDRQNDGKLYGNTKCWQEHGDGVNTISNRSHNVTKIAPSMSQQGLLMRSKLETLMLDSEKWSSIGNYLSDITHITRPHPLCAKHLVQ